MVRAIPAKVFPAPTPEMKPTYRFESSLTKRDCSGLKVYSLGVLEVKDNALSVYLVFVWFLLFLTH
jgi:hypothetical protein